MERSRTRGDRSRGFASVIGIALVLLGALLLWINLEGPRVLLTLLEALPVAAAWWPLLLIGWGAAKVIGRLTTGRTSFRWWEFVVLFLVILVGTSLSIFVRVMERTEFDRRLGEIARWTEEFAVPLPEHVFVSERTIFVPATPGEPPSLTVSLPMGAITAKAREPAQEEDAGTPDEAPSEASDDTAEEPRGANLTLRLTTRLRGATREDAARAAGQIGLTVRTAGEGGASTVVGIAARGADLATGRELALEAPPGLRLEARSERGPVRVRGPFARVRARASRGPVEASGARGEVFLSARDGAVRAAEIAGPVEIRVTRGPVEVEAVEGSLGVEAEDGPVWIREVRGAVTVSGSGAPIEVTGSSGPVRIDGRVASVSLADIAGDVRIRSDHGRIAADRIGGDLEITTRTAAVLIEDIRGEVRLTAPDADLVVRRVLGPVTIRGGSGELLAASLRGPAQFAAGSGSITIRDFLDELRIETGEGPVDLATADLRGEVDVSTRGGDVRLGLPDSASFSFRGADRGGEFESHLPLRMEEGEGGPIRVAVSGSGEFPIRVAAGRGRVVIHALERMPTQMPTRESDDPSPRAEPEGEP